jgi:hypothetical protein
MKRGHRLFTDSPLITSFPCSPDSQHFDRLLMKGSIALFKCGPIRWRSLHICSGARKSVVSILLPIFKQLVGKYYRVRTILQTGSDSEIVYGMETYGLLGKNLFSILGRNLQNDNVSEWVQARRLAESQAGEDAQDAVVAENGQDVLVENTQFVTLAGEGVERDMYESNGRASAA